MGADRGHERREKCRDHQPAQRRRKEVAQDHDVALLRIGGEFGAGRHAAVRRVKRESDESGDDPRPGTKGVVGDVEPKRGAERILFVLGAEHALRHVAAAAGFRAGIPGAPPLNAEKEDERDERKRPHGIAGEGLPEIGEEGEWIGDVCARGCDGGADDVQAEGECVEAADFDDSNPGENGDHSHFQNELEKIGDEYAPKSADEGVQAGEGDQAEDADHQRGVMRIAERVMEKRVAAEREFDNFAFRDGGAEEDGDDVNHRARDPAEDEAVHEQAEVDGFEAAEEGSGLAGVAKLGELDVGHYFGATPIAREEKDREHAGEALVPPEPVAGDALRGDEASDEKRRVGSECGGDHGRSGEPPGNIAAGDEEFGGVAGSAAAVVDADHEIDQQVADDDGPVDSG